MKQKRAGKIYDFLFNFRKKHIDMANIMERTPINKRSWKNSG
jgi:prephenate dehydratase